MKVSSPTVPVAAALALVALLAVVAYAPALDGEFVWDDQTLLTDQLPHFDSLKDAFRPPPRIPTWTYAYFRPVGP